MIQNGVVLFREEYSFCSCSMIKSELKLVLEGSQVFMEFDQIMQYGDFYLEV